MIPKIGFILILGTTINPNTIYPNTTWVQLANSLLRNNHTDTPGTTGGSATSGGHALTVAQLPSGHNHAAAGASIRRFGNNTTSAASSSGIIAIASASERSSFSSFNTTTPAGNLTLTTPSRGSGTAHTHAGINPPFINVRAWMRTI